MKVKYRVFHLKKNNFDYGTPSNIVTNESSGLATISPIFNLILDFIALINLPVYVNILTEGGFSVGGSRSGENRLKFSETLFLRALCLFLASYPKRCRCFSATTRFQIPELRLLYPNGTLVFPPFPSELYRHDVHAALYRCRLRSALGTVLSRDVHVKAGKKQKTSLCQTVHLPRSVAVSSMPLSRRDRGQPWPKSLI